MPRVPSVITGSPVYGVPVGTLVYRDFALGLTVTSNVGYTSIASITDGSDTTAGAATQVTKPQWLQLDLGRARVIRTARMLYIDDTHLMKAGSMQSSMDGTAWTDVVTVSGNTSLLLVLPVMAVGRYWRHTTTDTNSAGTGVNIYTWNMFGYG